MRGAAEGRVYLVGTGIGDPDFLTMRADRILRTVDAIVHDRSVSAAILSIVPEGTERIIADDPDEAEHQALQALTTIALQGRSVACVKGGDAFAFGECTPLARLLAEASIPFEIVPAISIPAGWGARTGTPLTHRGAATGICFIRLDAGGIEPDWKRLIDPQTTIALYGNMELAAESLELLIDAGLPPDTPAAILEET
ncbi:MAG: SAM-dependent methyltransferase, partial [Rhodospirillales bacterium]|nr:SAM-dependent methyltransferase [Rhodospirillales bacterium]